MWVKEEGREGRPGGKSRRIIATTYMRTDLSDIEETENIFKRERISMPRPNYFSMLQDSHMTVVHIFYKERRESLQMLLMYWYHKQLCNPVYEFHPKVPVLS